MTDFLCPTCGPITEDDGLLIGPGDAVCCAFCGCPEEDMTPLREAYELLALEKPRRQQVAAEAYQIIGALADGPRFDTAPVQDALSYFGDMAAGRNPERVKSVLPFQAPAAVPGFGPLVAPSSQAIEVFQKVLENKPDADMRAVPNQWLLNERATLEKIVNDMETTPAAVPDIIDQLADDMYAAEPDPNDTDYMWDTNDCRDWLKEQAQKMRAAPAPAAPESESEIERRVRRSQEALNRPLKDTVRLTDTTAPGGFRRCPKCRRAYNSSDAAECLTHRHCGYSVDNQQAALFKAHNGAED